LEISQKYINWHKLQQKIEAALKLVDNKFKGLNQDGEVTEVTLDDALTFRVTKEGVVFCYKIFKPRYVGTKHAGIKSGLYCSGLQIGTYDTSGRPVFFQPARMF
jgi:hypothetical protein